MYLSKLTNQSRHLFLELEIYLARTDDGIINQNEKEMINAHCLEMGLYNNNYLTVSSFEELLVELSKCPPVEQRIIFIELMAAAIGDDVLQDYEMKVMDAMGQAIHITREEILHSISIINNIKKAYREFSDFIFR